MQRLKQHLFKPINIASLIFFRIVAHKKVQGWLEVLFRQQMFAVEYVRKRFGNVPFRVVADVSDLPFGGADIQMGLKVMPLVMRYCPGKNLNSSIVR